MKRRAYFPRLGILAVAAAVGAVGLAGPVLSAPAHAAEYDVTSGADEGPGTLREAIESIEPGGDSEVTIAPGLEIILKQPIEIPDQLTVIGDQADLPVVTFDPEESSNPGTLFSHHGDAVDFRGEFFAVRGIPVDEEDWDAWRAILSADGAGDANVEFEGIEATGIRRAVEVGRAPEAKILIESSAFADVGPYRDGEGSLVELADEFGGSLTVRNSTFTRVWHHLAWADLASGTITIEGSRFERPSLPSWESMAGVLAVDFAGGATPSAVPVVIRNSTFSGGGADVAGTLAFESDGPVGTPIAAEITGTTFVGNVAGEDAANAIEMELDDPATSVVIQNSTFSLPPTAAEYREMEASVRQEYGNSARLVLDHVTSVGVGVSADETPVVTIRDSAFQTTETGIVFGTEDAWVIEQGDELPPMDLSQVEIERTVVSVPGPRFPDLPATPEAEFLLGDLDNVNGGPTPTMLPGPGSALLGAAGGELTVDQRGLMRPVGGKTDAGSVEVQDAVVSLVEDVTVPEGQPLEFVVTREGGEAGYPASVAYATADGTAVTPTNYASATGTLEWAAGDVEPKRITVESVRDGVVTDPLSFTMGLTEPGSGTVILEGAQQRTGTLTNLDEEEAVVPPTPDPDPDPEPTPDPDPKPDPEPTQPPAPPAPGGGLAQTGADDAGGLWALGALGAGVGVLALMRGLRRRGTAE